MVCPLKSRITTLYLFIFLTFAFVISCIMLSYFMSLPAFSPADCIMTDSMMSKAATMEIPINSNGDTRTIAEDDGLEQVG